MQPIKRNLIDQNDADAAAATTGLLNELARRLHLGAEESVPSVTVTGISCDPEEIRPGDLYVALRRRAPGSVGAAIGRGAVAVVSEESLKADLGVPVVRVQDEVRALGHLAARLFGKPARGLRTCAVTGTFGKTSVSSLAAAGLQAAGLASGVVDRARRIGPSPHRLQGRLASLRDRGATACVVEAGVQDLVRGRFEGTGFDSAVFLGARTRCDGITSEASEHLDAMTDLFRGLDERAIAVLNRDDPAWSIFDEETRAQVITYGSTQEADVRVRVCGLDLDGASLEVRTPYGTIDLRTRLVGLDHAQNSVAALTVALGLGADLDGCARGIAGVRSVAGCLEPLAAPRPYRVFLDTAPDAAAVAQALISLRPLVRGRLIVVAGATDESDRALGSMARAIEGHADLAIVTEGVRTTTSRMTNICRLMAGFRLPADVRIDPSRSHAIALALESAREGDVVLAFGRGDGAEERRAVRDWFLADLEAEAVRGPQEEA